MITRILSILILGIFISACTTTPEKEGQAEVVDKSTGAAATESVSDAVEPGDDAQAFPVDEHGAGDMSQLQDPENLLSMRIIYFEYDSSAVLPRFSEIIEAHARFLQANPGQGTTLEGHADERGSREYNLALGERRALAVKQQLVILGADPSQITTVSYGEERPADPGHDQVAWEQNRRVELVY